MLMNKNEGASCHQNWPEGKEENYPSDCEVLAGLRQKAISSHNDDERGHAWRTCFPKAARVKLLLLDVDGVLTDGSLVYSNEGEEIKTFHCRDGLGMRLLRRTGVEVGIISARRSQALSRRAADLALIHVYQGIDNKLEVYNKILKEVGLSPLETAFVGDDWLDLPILVRVGFSATVADGAHEVRRVVDYTARRTGGRGAVREVCDLIIEAKGAKDRLLNDYLA